VTARILVAEDNPTNLALMEYLLRAFGYTVLTAADGEAAVELARREVPDVILMDVHMPRLNGYEAAARLKQIPELSAVPIVAVTALAMVGDREKILAQGFDGYIAKPITPEAFVPQVEAFLPPQLHSAARPPGGPSSSGGPA